MFSLLWADFLWPCYSEVCLLLFFDTEGDACNIWKLIPDEGRGERSEQCHLLVIHWRWPSALHSSTAQGNCGGREGGETGGGLKQQTDAAW